MEIAFETIFLREICEDIEIAKRELGKIVAEILKHRLADLRAAVSIKDILVGNPRVLSGEGLGQMALELCNGWQLVFCANHPKMACDKGPDWAKVRRIKILHIKK